MVIDIVTIKTDKFKGTDKTEKTKIQNIKNNKRTIKGIIEQLSSIY
jgi:hypothetical protein